MTYHIMKKGENMKTDCSVDPFLNTTLFSTHMATCWFMYLKPNTSPFWWLSPDEKEAFDPLYSTAYTCDQKRKKFKDFMHYMAVGVYSLDGHVVIDRALTSSECNGCIFCLYQILS